MASQTGEPFLFMSIEIKELNKNNQPLLNKTADELVTLLFMPGTDQTCKISEMYSCISPEELITAYRILHYEYMLSDDNTITEKPTDTIESLLNTGEINEYNATEVIKYIERKICDKRNGTEVDSDDIDNISGCVRRLALAKIIHNSKEYIDSINNLNSLIDYNKFSTLLNELFGSQFIGMEVRVKSLESLVQKLIRKGLDRIDSAGDIIGIRIVTQDISTTDVMQKIVHILSVFYSVLPQNSSEEMTYKIIDVDTNNHVSYMKIQLKINGIPIEIMFSSEHQVEIGKDPSHDLCHSNYESRRAIKSTEELKHIFDDIREKISEKLLGSNQFV